MSNRPLNQIAQDIVKDWKKPNYAAVPYIEAMLDLNNMKDNYYADSAQTIVLYFLANASTWRGDVAKKIKTELKSMIK